VDIVKRAIEEPLRALAATPASKAPSSCRKSRSAKATKATTSATGEYEDLVKAGVVDPKKVTRTALQNAASIAGLLLTTECLITEMPEKEKARSPAAVTAAGMGGMDYSVFNYSVRNTVEVHRHAPAFLSARAAEDFEFDWPAEHRLGNVKQTLQSHLILKLAVPSCRLNPN
jgi:hypothetical protein